MLIYKALLAYGFDGFTLEILEYCQPLDLIKREQYYIDLLKPEYNILKVAGSSLGVKRSEETKAKLKEKALARTSPRVLSKEFLNAMKKNSKAIILYNLSNNTVYGEYVSISEAAKYLNCNEKTIRRALKTDKKILLRR